MDEKKIILITGTSRGIGRYLVQYYVNRGFLVYGCSRRPADYELDHYRHFCLDIADQSAVKAMLTSIRKTHRQLDVVVNNAAINDALAPVLLVSYESALETIKTNLLGTILVAREAAKTMIATRNRSGRIINFSSMAVKHEVVGEAVYTATKSAVIAFTRVMAKEVHANGITCNVIAPAAHETDLLGQVDKGAVTELLKRNAIHTLGKMEDISNAVDWLIRPESNAITGQTIYLGGA